MPVRVLTEAGRAVGIAGFSTRNGGFITLSAKAVILATGARGCASAASSDRDD
jgi:succinate dehydrogenase/fumarate reductase flavoprotein subunit